MINSWIQSQHLDPVTRMNSRERFLQDQSLIRLPEILTDEKARALHSFMAKEARWEPGYVLLPHKRVDRETWDSADDKSRLFQYQELLGRDPDKARITAIFYLKFLEFLKSDDCRKYFEAITGISLTSLESVSGKGLKAGDFLRPHGDRAKERKLAFIFYLNLNWDPEFGGALTVRHHDDSEETLEYLPNSLVLFDVNGHKQHWIEPIGPEAGDELRFSVGGWFQ